MFGYRKKVLEKLDAIQNSVNSVISHEKNIEDGLLALALRVKRVEDNQDTLVKVLSKTLEDNQKEVVEQYATYLGNLGAIVAMLREELKQVLDKTGSLERIEPMFVSMINNTDKLGRDYDRLNDTITEFIEGSNIDIGEIKP